MESPSAIVTDSLPTLASDLSEPAQMSNQLALPSQEIEAFVKEPILIPLYYNSNLN